MSRATARIGRDRYSTRIEAPGHPLVADEPESNGGSNSGPNPYDLLLSALGACTAITLRMYAQRKGWNLTAVDVEAQLFREGSESHIDRSISLHGDLDEAQTARLLEVSERTPVTLALKGGVEIRTRLDQSGVT